MEGLPREMILHILEFCPPRDYGAFLQATSLVHPVDKGQLMRKKREKYPCFNSDFVGVYCEWLTKQVLDVMFPNDGFGGVEEFQDYQVICAYLLEFLYDFSAFCIDLFRKYYHAWLNGSGGFLFPSWQDVQVFVEFSEMSTMTGYNHTFEDLMQRIEKYTSSDDLRNLFPDE